MPVKFTGTDNEALMLCKLAAFWLQLGAGNVLSLEEEQETRNEKKFIPNVAAFTGQI